MRLSKATKVKLFLKSLNKRGEHRSATSLMFLNSRDSFKSLSGRLQYSLASLTTFKSFFCHCFLGDL